MKRLHFCYVILIVALLNCSLAAAQNASLEKEVVTKQETHTFELPKNDVYLKSFPFQIDAVGKIAGEIHCQTEGNVPATYNHLVFFLYQKSGTTLSVKESHQFKEGATVSFDVNEAALNAGNNFIFTARLLHAQAQCDCELDITFTETKKIAVDLPVQKKITTPVLNNRNSAVRTKK